MAQEIISPQPAYRMGPERSAHIPRPTFAPVDMGGLDAYDFGAQDIVWGSAGALIGHLATQGMSTQARWLGIGGGVLAGYIAAYYADR
jgi:hypothetical protein